MISIEERNELIKFRIEQAKETISDAEILIKFGKFRSAVNRIYYGMFYCLLALGLKHQFESSKHQQLIGWFNKNFIHTGKIDEKFGVMLRDAFKERQKGDYEIFVQFTKEEVDEMFADMKIFVAEIENHLENE